jgi:hypothetical protein
MRPFQSYLIFILLLSCQFKRNSYDINIVEKLSKSQLDSIEMKSYYGYDSLDLGEYQTKFGHLIQLQGSKSGSLYRIKVKTKDNRTRLFKITDNPYISNHAQILWDNDEFIFIRTACGTECWLAIVLSLKGKMQKREYYNYLYEDSLKNQILYLSETDWNSIIFKDLSTEKQDSQFLDLCDKATIPIFSIDTTIYKEPNSIEVLYKGKDCDKTKVRTFKLE